MLDVDDRDDAVTGSFTRKLGWNTDHKMMVVAIDQIRKERGTRSR